MFEHKFYGERVRQFSDRIAHVLYDAYRQMEEEREACGMPSPIAAEVNIISFPELWPGEEVAGQASIVIDETRQVAYVYHERRFSQRVERPTAAFWAAVGERKLPRDDMGAWRTFSGTAEPAHV